MSSKRSSAGFPWLMKMALRDGKASSRKLFLFIASIVLGIAAVVSIQSFSANLKRNISLQSKSLMGADYIIDSDKLPTEKVYGIIDSLGGAEAREISFASMASFPEKNGTKLMQVRGIEGGFPFYGEIETTPAQAAKNFKEFDVALVDATVMLQLGLKVGDVVKIGNTSLEIGGALNNVPGSSSVFSSIAPPLLVPFSAIEKSGLVQTGSRIDYRYYFTAPENLDMEKFDEKLDPILDANDADLDTHLSTSQRLGRRYENFAKFLNLVAFIALLLGCVGIASAIHIYIKEKVASIAILKCLGASRKQSFQIFLIQVIIIGLIGSVIGTLLGLGLQELFPYLLQDLLPVEIDLQISPVVIITGIMLGVSMSVLFALYPLLTTLDISPLQTLRMQQSAGSNKKYKVLVSVAVIIFIWVFAFWLLDNWLYAIWFVLGLAITFAILSGFAALIMKLLKRYFPKNWGFPARQSVLNLYRPQNQTLILILAIGIGTFLISTLYFTRDLLLAQTTLESQQNTPNMILLDVQSEQKDEVKQVIDSSNLVLLQNIPIVTMRVIELKGRSANEIREDTSSTINNWVLDHEFRTTYRDSLAEGEEILGGKWKANFTGDGPIPISISDNLAEDAEAAIGDKIIFNVQGVQLVTEVASIRKVDWSNMQINFSILFPTGVLEDAPQFTVMTTRVEDDNASAQLQQKLVQQFPNVTIIDLRQVLKVVEEILGKISWLINFMAFFSIFTGIIVLIGAVRTSKYQRIRESVLLRTLGAKNRQILKILGLEYLFLGILGSLSGILLSFISSFLIGYFLFDTTFTPSMIPFFVVFPAITALVVIIGLANSYSVVKSPPLAVLRKELG
ncbi:FtsX-like permease family protein [uncultured Christiangramia sp.]|uniref:ABC transporter permease n=1 Tax=uncultured Christiangramia sp. TaxID=503836 RepID=UPI002635F1FD|nr:FtsX-like permease family protein [uncultured Christiangramia sp.]